jgi:protein-S-isoprenylcysteine O-methyltransferase Ste14
MNQYTIKHFSGTILFFLIIFISAGRIDYWQGWIYVTIGLAMFTLSYTILRVNTELLEERSKPQEGTKKWDKLLLGLSFLITVIMYITAGLDSGRFHRTTGFHWSLCIPGIILTVAGQLLFLIAQKQNRFFSSTVRIQTERGHVVCDTGLYKIVRHPAYLGNLIQTLGFPLLFNSFWSVVPISFSVLILIIRTQLEDRTLKNELNGYLEYAYNIRYKLIPYIW